MVLQRAPLGQRGSYLATGLNVLQCLGWSIFEITVIATAAGALSDRALRLPPRLDLEARASARSGSCSRCSGPIGFVRRFVRKIGDLGRRRVDRLPRVLDPRARPTSARLWHEGGQRRLVLARRRPRDRAHRLVDAARRRLHALLARPPRSAFWGAGLGYLLPTLFQFGFGAILVLSHPSITGPTDVLTTVAAGGVGARPRAARAHRRRDRRGVREHLLDRRLAAELRPARVAARADRRRARVSRPRSRSAST